MESTYNKVADVKSGFATAEIYFDRRQQEHFVHMPVTRKDAAVKNSDIRGSLSCFDGMSEKPYYLAPWQHEYLVDAVSWTEDAVSELNMSLASMLMDMSRSGYTLQAPEFRVDKDLPNGRIEVRFKLHVESRQVDDVPIALEIESEALKQLKYVDNATPYIKRAAKALLEALFFPASYEPVLPPSDGQALSMA